MEGQTLSYGIPVQPLRTGTLVFTRAEKSFDPWEKDLSITAFMSEYQNEPDREDMQVPLLVCPAERHLHCHCMIQDFQAKTAKTQRWDMTCS